MVRGGVGVALAAVGGLVLVRAALGGSLYALDMIYMGRETWGWAMVVGHVVVGFLLTNLGGFVVSREGGWRALGRGSVGIGCAVLVAVIGANYARHHVGTLAWAFNSERAPGQFPYAAGRVIEEKRPGYHGVAHIGETGFRVCGPDRQTGDEVVSLYGDSMMFGQGVPDEDSPCWLLREHYATAWPDRYRFQNRAQPGANIHSYADNFDYAEEHWPSDVALVGLLLPNDGQMVDVNDQRELRDAWWVRLGSALVDPDLVFSSIYAFAKFGRSEMSTWLSVRHGVDRLVEVTNARGVRSVWFAWDDPHFNHRDHDLLRAYDAMLREAVADEPLITYVGVITEEDPPEGVDYRVPGDGHPTSAGIAAMVPKWVAALDGSGR